MKLVVPLIGEPSDFKVCVSQDDRAEDYTPGLVTILFCFSNFFSNLSM